MTITKNEITVVVNENLERTETDIDDKIKAILKKLSRLGDWDCLGVSDSLTLASGAAEVAFPDGYRKVKAIWVPGGTTEMAKFESPRPPEGKLSQGKPTMYEEFEGKFRFDRVADQEYTIPLDYWRYHPDSVGTILFGEEFRLCLEYGASWLVAQKYGRLDQVAIFMPLFNAEVSNLRDDEKTQPTFSPYSDY